jgi:hypothetical protein
MYVLVQLNLDPPILGLTTFYLPHIEYEGSRYWFSDEKNEKKIADFHFL